MGKKKVFRRKHAFWAVPGNWLHRNFTLRSIYLAKNPAAFTLIELLVVVAMLAILMTVLVLYLDPVGQINKARDAQRLHDIAQMQRAMDVYYNDNKCYPTATTKLALSSNDSGAYLKQIPTDPATKQNYIFVEDGSCSQWMVLFTKLSKAPTTQAACALAGLTDCLPRDYDNTWACIFSGDVDCSVIANYWLVATPTPTPTPTLTPTVNPQGPRIYACAGGGAGFAQQCNLVGEELGVYTTSNCDNMCQ